MNVSIVLKDTSDGIRVELSNSANRGTVHLTLYKGQTEISAEINIEEIKHALRKLSAK